MTSRQAFALHAAILMSLSLFVVILNILIFNQAIWSVFVVLAAGLIAWLHYMIVSDLEKRAEYKLLAPPERTEPSSNDKVSPDSDESLNDLENNANLKDNEGEQQPFSTPEDAAVSKASESLKPESLQPEGLKEEEASTSQTR